MLTCLIRLDVKAENNVGVARKCCVMPLLCERYHMFPYVNFQVVCHVPCHMRSVSDQGGSLNMANAR